MELLDLVIVGAGFRGLAIAKTYHQVHPDKSILILDGADTIGGCWAAENIYEGLNMNNTFGSYEFSDFPMKPESGEATPDRHIPGSDVHKYLCEAARFYDVDKYIRLQTRVETVLLRHDDLWEISFTSTTSPSEKPMKVLSKVLIFATGVSNTPFIPTFEGRDQFQGSLFHTKHLKTRSGELSRGKTVVVVGSNKSALDASYLIAQAGGIAHMVIRPSGAGPSYSWPPLISWLGRLIPPFLLVVTRFYLLFDPWPFSPRVSWTQEFLHRSTLGMWLTQLFWKAFGSYTREMEGDPRTEKLMPWTSTYWMATSLSAHNYPNDFLQYVREGTIVVHHAEVVSLSQKAVQLTDGAISNVDAVICATGYRPAPTVKFLPEGLEDSTGMPANRSGGDEDVVAVQKARNYILNRRPFLRNHPQPGRPPTTADTRLSESKQTPYQLYRGLVPANKRFLLARNLAFIGADTALITTTVSEAEALWITAFLDNKIRNLDPSTLDLDQIRQQTILYSEYFRIRRPAIAGGFGERFPDLCFDCLLYVDLLLNDLGLQTRRKRSWYQDWFTPYGGSEYKGLVSEWQRSIGRYGA